MTKQKAWTENWTIRKTEEREQLVEELRQWLKDSGRDVEMIHGVVTTAAVFDEALKALKQQVD